MKQLFLFTLVLLLSSSSIQSQSITFGATANLGISRITSSDNPFREDFKTRFTLSGNTGFFLETRINSKMSLGVEALWVRIEGREVNKDALWTTSSGVVVGAGSITESTHSNYFGIPIYYRHKIRDFGIKAGCQLLVFVSGNTGGKSEGSINGSPFSNKRDKENLELNSIDLGPKLGMDYQLNNKLLFRADLYYGMVNTSPNEQYGEKNNMQFSFGLSYLFSKIK